MADSQALLRLVEAPQPLARRGAPPALPALAAADARGGKKGLASAAPAPSAAFPGMRNGYNSPSFQDAPPAVGVSGRQAGLTVRVFSAFCHRTLLQLSRRQKRRSGVATVSEEDADYRPRGFHTGTGGDEVDYSFTSPYKTYSVSIMTKNSQVLMFSVRTQFIPVLLWKMTLFWLH